MTAVWAVLLSISGFLGCKRLKFTSQTVLLFVIILIFSIWSILTVGLSYGVIMFFSYFPALILLIIPVERQKELLYFVTKWFGILMILSLLIFVITRFVSISPPLGVLYLEDLNYDPFNNFVLFIESQSIFNLFIYRFNGPFLEPGHLSLLASLLIFANQYDFKRNKYLWICLVCIVISLSLAGYVILTLGYIVFKVKNLKKLLFFLLFIGSIFLYVAVIWENGNNPVNELIFARLEYDDEKGIAGNNRTNEQTDNYFKSNFKAGKLWIGLGNQKKDDHIRGAGYKIYFLRYGIISFIIVLIIYLNLIPHNVNRRYACGFFFMIVVIFLQRSYPDWYSWLFSFTLGCGISRENDKNNRQKYHEIPVKIAKKS